MGEGGEKSDWLRENGVKGGQGGLRKLVESGNGRQF